MDASLIPKTHPGGAGSVGRAEGSVVVDLAERAHLPRRPLHLLPRRHPAQDPRQRAQAGGGGAVQPVGLVPPPDLWGVCQGGGLLATTLTGAVSKSQVLKYPLLLLKYPPLLMLKYPPLLLKYPPLVHPGPT